MTNTTDIVFIHFTIITAYPAQGHTEAWILSQSHLAREGINPGEAISSKVIILTQEVISNTQFRLLELFLNAVVPF